METTRCLNDKKVKVYKKLVTLCERSNKRSQRGLNDDDQVKEMFDYARKNKNLVRVGVGYDNYKAFRLDYIKDVIEKYKNKELVLGEFRYFEDNNLGKLIGVSIGEYRVWLTMKEFNN